MDNWVVLFVRTGSEEKMVDILKYKLDNKAFEPFLPTKKELLKKDGAWHEVTKPLFPSYIFIKTSIEPLFISDELNSTLENLRSSYPFMRLLHYGNDKKNVVIREKERNFFLGLLDADYCVAISKGFKVDDKIHITEGPLVGLGSAIKMFNRRQCKASLDVEFAGELCEVRLGLEVVSRVT